MLYESKNDPPKKFALLIKSIEQTYFSNQALQD